MSSAAPEPRSRLPRLAPQFAHAAVARARLSLVPRPRSRQRAPRVPFVTLISVVLLSGVVGLLLFNTSMQQASFRASALERQAGDLSARQESLEMQLQRLRDPQRVATRAQQMGLVIPTSPAGVLHLGTGAVEGDPEPATGGQRLPLRPPAPGRPAVLDPDPVQPTPERRGAGRRDDADRTGGANEPSQQNDAAAGGAGQTDSNDRRGTRTGGDNAQTGAADRDGGAAGGRNDAER